jgi:hypothetical protein
MDCFVASAPVRKRFAFVAGNDGVSSHHRTHRRHRHLRGDRDFHRRGHGARHQPVEIANRLLLDELDRDTVGQQADDASTQAPTASGMPMNAVNLLPLAAEQRTWPDVRLARPGSE